MTNSAAHLKRMKAKNFNNSSWVQKNPKKILKSNLFSIAFNNICAFFTVYLSDLFFVFPTQCYSYNFYCLTLYSSSVSLLICILLYTFNVFAILLLFVLHTMFFCTQKCTGWQYNAIFLFSKNPHT